VQEPEEKGLGLEIDGGGIIAGIWIAISQMKATVKVGSAFRVIGGHIVFDKPGRHHAIEIRNNQGARKGK